MNPENLRRVADAIEAERAAGQHVNFDMGTWGDESGGYHRHSCGTAACIAGFAYSMTSAETRKKIWKEGLRAPHFGPAFNVGKYVLGLEESEAFALFTGSAVSLLEKKEDIAADALRYIAERGEEDPSLKITLGLLKEGIRYAQCVKEKKNSCSD